MVFYGSKGVFLQAVTLALPFIRSGAFRSPKERFLTAREMLSGSDASRFKFQKSGLGFQKGLFRAAKVPVSHTERGSFKV